MKIEAKVCEYYSNNNVDFLVYVTVNGFKSELFIQPRVVDNEIEDITTSDSQDSLELVNPDCYDDICVAMQDALNEYCKKVGML